jgi:hypothetical protein
MNRLLCIAMQHGVEKKIENEVISGLLLVAASM